MVVVPCAGVQPITEALEDCMQNTIPIILYAVSQDSISADQKADLLKIRDLLPFPICFVRVPSAPSAPASRGELGALQKQLLSLGLLPDGQGNCSCGAPSQTLHGSSGKPPSVLGESLDRLHRLLVHFIRQVFTSQLVEAANRLNALHCSYLDLFINQVGRRRGTYIRTLRFFFGGIVCRKRLESLYSVIRKCYCSR